MMVEEQESVSGPGCNCSTLAAISANALESSIASRPPSGVAWTDRAPRISSGIANISSRLLIWRLTAPCVTDSSSAAADMLESRTVASKARRAFNDGRFTLRAGLPRQGHEVFSQRKE